MRRIILTVIVMLLAACAEERRPDAQASLYERLGEKGAIVAVVDDFVGNVGNDARINHYFENTDIPNLKAKLVDQICQASGGPCTYTGRDMKSTHAHMGVSEADFNALVEDLVKSLNKFNVSQREQDDLLALLSPMKPDIVSR